ncbi:MAG: hypothetical protein OCD02_01740 [Spirochaetaceae bacterium]
MLRKIIFILLILYTILPIFSNNKIVLLTSNNDTYNHISKLLNNSDNINLTEIIIIEVNDNLEISDYSGSKEYLEKELLNYPRAIIYLEITESDKINIYGFTPGLLPNIEITQNIITSFRLGKDAARLFPLYVTRLIQSHGLVDIFNSHDIPLLLLSGNIRLERLVDTLKVNPKNIKNPSLYYIFSILNNTYFIDSKLLFIINISFIILIVLLITFFSKRLKFHIKLNRYYILTIPLKILFIFIFYFISTLVITFISGLAGDGFIEKFPKTIFVIKNLILFFIYGISFQIIKDEGFSKSPYFYSYISFFISIFIYFISCIIFLPLGLYQIWPIIMTILFILFRSNIIKSLLLLISPLILILIFSKFLLPGNSQALQLLISSKYTGNILLTIIITPYIFLQDSYYRFSHRRHKYLSNSKDIIISLFTLTFTITITAILLELH